MAADGAFDALVADAMAVPVAGWRFPFLEARIVREPPSWDYTGAARTLLGSVAAALDHGAVRFCATWGSCRGCWSRPRPTRPTWRWLPTALGLSAPMSCR